jgi:hypothetical protein
MIPIGLVVALINSFFIGLFYIDQSPPQYSIPTISLLNKSFDLSDSKVTILINTSIYVIRNISCRLDNAPLQISYSQTNTNLSLTIFIPKSYYSELWVNASRKGLSLTSPPASVYQSFSYHCELYFDKGYAETTFLETFNWREPDIYVENRSVLVITNPNPVNLNISVVVYDPSRMRIVSSFNISIGYLSNYSINISEVAGEKGSYEIRIYYEFLGNFRGRGVRIDL